MSVAIGTSVGGRYLQIALLVQMSALVEKGKPAEDLGAILARVGPFNFKNYDCILSLCAGSR